MAMTIELKPEQERILQEALRQGRFQSVEEALAQAIQSIASREDPRERTTRPSGKKSLVQLFAESPLKGGRSVEL
jgi:Arc/MetJ-type ribon-helix-helix transcriptional regulator